MWIRTGENIFAGILVGCGRSECVLSTIKFKESFIWHNILDHMVVASSVSGAKHTSAKWVCQIMVNLVRHTECLAACNDLLEVELSQLVTYDVVEYGLCEHRRLLAKARRRQKGRSLSTCKLTVTHRAAILQARSSSLSRRSIKHIELPNPDRNRWTWCATQSL